jgi:guanylate kinase
MAGAFILSGPSAGVGKDTLIDMVTARNPNLVKARNWTTRSIRAGEAADAYVFATPAEFDDEIVRGNFLEYADVNGKLYGSHKPTILNAVHQGKTVVMRVEVKGHALIKIAWPDVKSVFILPPSMVELERRIRCRGTESEEVIQQRLALAKIEIARCTEYDYMIVNDDEFLAAARLKAFIADL